VKIGILLLAAGSSRRFGSDKRRALLPDGRSLLQTTLDAITASGLPAQLCLPAGYDVPSEMRSRQQLTVQAINHPERGMGVSLAQGMAALPAWDGVLIALADMPWIQAESYIAIAAALTQDTICVPVHAGCRGNPVGFGRVFFPQLCALEGDMGARQLLRDHSARVREVAVPDAGIRRDVDTPEQLPEKE
jgi:molybdenum cofactor cytidylyltransferase